MPETSTTETEVKTDATNSTTQDTSTTSTDTNETAKQGDNPDASKPNDTTVVGDDKSQQTSKTNDTPATFDDDLDDWATKRGFPKATTDTEKQAYQDQRDQQREYTRAQQAKTNSEDLTKEVGKAKSDIPKEEDDEDLDPLEKRQNAIEAQLHAERETRLQSEFYTENKVTPEEHKMLLAVMTEKFNRPTTPEGKKNAVETWSNPDALPDLLDIAKARIAKTVGTSDITDEAARKERERIAKESNANSPNRGASTTTTSDKTEDAARLERFKARYNKS